VEQAVGWFGDFRRPSASVASCRSTRKALSYAAGLPQDLDWRCGQSSAASGAAPIRRRVPPPREYRPAAAGYSPDRVDALVCAFSELLVEPMEGEGIFEFLPPVRRSRRAAQHAATCSNRAPARLDGVARRAGEERLNHGGPRAEMCMRDRDNVSSRNKRHLENLRVPMAPSRN